MVLKENFDDSSIQMQRQLGSTSNRCETNFFAVNVVQIFDVFLKMTFK